MITLGALNFLRGAHSSIYNVVWQPFVLSLGASMPTLGLVNSIGGMGGIVTTVIQSFGGWLADRVGRKPLLVVSSLALIVGYALCALAGALFIWSLVLLGIILIGASHISRPALSSITAESVHTGRQGSAFSLMMVASLVPGIIVPVFAGALADRFGYVLVFVISLALEVIVLLLLWRGLRETGVRADSRVRLREGLRVLVSSFVPPARLRGFFIATAVDSFVWGMGWGLLFGMLTDAYRFTAEQLGFIAAANSLSWALLQLPMGRLIDRQHLKRMMIVSEAFGAPMALIVILQPQFEMVVLAQVFYAVTAATWVPVVSTFLTRSVATQERGQVFGQFAAFRGIVAFPAPALGGWLYVWGGFQAPLIANVLGMFAVMALLVLFVKEPQAHGDSQTK